MNRLNSLRVATLSRTERLCSFKISKLPALNQAARETWDRANDRASLLFCGVSGDLDLSPHSHDRLRMPDAHCC